MCMQTTCHLSQDDMRTGFNRFAQGFFQRVKRPFETAKRRDE